MAPYPHLERINAPADLRALDRRDLDALAAELRAFLIESVSRTGGHLSSNLGTVELTIALHRVFNTPYDRIVWDVGHQTYGHKILTGRRDAMSGLRHWGGISGFPRRCESEYDTFGTAHSSTSISAALGMAVAARARGEERSTVAVIGDGAMSAGMAFEALNNAGDMEDINLLVILNDNEMSISPPVGALTKILARMLSGSTYNTARRVGERVLGMAPPVAELARKVEEYAKGMISPGTLFEEFGFHYYGPIDGHDLDALIPTLQNLKKLKGPQFLHVITKKGQGYKLAEADPILYHGVSKFDHTAGIQTGKGVLRRSGREVALIAFGSLVAPALQAGEALDASVADMRFVKPLDLDLLRELAQGHRLLVTLEENAVAGGAGAGVAEALAGLGIPVPVLHLGLPDTFIEHGDPVRMLAGCGLDAAGIEAAVRQRITLLPE
jgi:1-deoxy-D-xylulose-5-phosphate synthase